MNPLDRHSYFFDAGIRFECRRCGSCCTGAPGIVRINAAEIDTVAAYLGLPASRVMDTHISIHGDGYRVRETADGRCLFFENGCQVYAVRPLQCRTFPFWFANLRSETRWAAIRRQCPGIGTGRLYVKTEILDILGRSA